jgi:hypothetical protein
MDESAVKLIAYILGDGSAAGAISVTSALPEVAADLEQIARDLGMTLVTYPKPGSPARQFRLVVPRGARRTAREAFTTALREAHSRSRISWQEWSRRAEVSATSLGTWRDGKGVPEAASLRRLARAVGLAIEEFAPAARDQADQQNAAARILADVGPDSARRVRRTSSCPAESSACLDRRSYCSSER